MIQIHIHVEGRDAIALLRHLVELESQGFADRMAAKALALTLRQHADAVKAAMNAATPPPAT